MKIFLWLVKRRSSKHCVKCLWCTIVLFKAKREIASTSLTSRTDSEAIAYVRKGFDTMKLILTNRHKNLEIVRALWTSGDVMVG